MPSDFTQTSISMSSKRTYVSPIATLANFSAVVAAFLADTTIGLSKKEKKTESYKVPVKFFDTESKQKGQVYLTVDNTTAYADAMNMLVADTDLSNSIAGAGSDSTEDETEALWSVRVSCELNGDTFSVTFNREYATVTGYSNVATLTALETWFDANANVA